MRDDDGENARDGTDLTYANFSFDEWIAALTPAYGSDGAKQWAEMMFTAIMEVGGSNGFSLPMEHWALLARLGESAEARVAEMTRDFPETCLIEIAAHRQTWDSNLGT
jgi:hypothetical protein